MQQEYLFPHHHDKGNAGQDRATAVLLTGGCNDGVPAFVLRHWRPGANPLEPVFVIWLLNIGRFCLTVKYGRHSLQSGQWHVDTGSGPRTTPSPLEEARGEALSIRDTLQERVNRPITVAPALAFFDTDPDRRYRALGPAKPYPAALGPGGLHWTNWPVPRPEIDSASPWSGGRPWRRYRRSWRASIRANRSHPEGPGWASGPHRHRRMHLIAMTAVVRFQRTIGNRRERRPLSLTGRRVDDVPGGRGSPGRNPPGSPSRVPSCGRA